MTRYAENTSVPSERSRAEIEQILRRYSATAFSYGWDQSRAVIMFELAGRRIRFDLPMPDPNDRQFTHTPSRGQKRSPAQQEQAYEQSVRQRWRALALVIKAKLEAVEAGITEFEDEFLAHVVLPNGERVGNWLRPQIARAYDTGSMPAMLPAPEGIHD